MKYLIPYSGIRTTVISIVAMLCGILNASGQLEKNNIYLFDCTGSMRSAGLWERAQQALDATISTQTSIPGSQFTIIPFGDIPYQTISFTDKEFANNKKSMTAAFDKWINQAKYTRITDVLKAGIDKCDIHKENKIYLLTDGEPNGGDTPDKVATLISNWCADHRNARLFYVALREGVVPGAVREAIDACPDAYIVQCKNSVIPQIGDISSEIHANIEELSTVHELSLSIPGDYPMTVTCDDILFTAEIPDAKASAGKIPVIIKAKDSLSPEALHQQLASVTNTHRPYTFSISISCPDENYFIANPDVTVFMTDHIQSRLTLAGGNDEINIGKASWHNSFLWSDASSPMELVTDLAPEFVNITDSQSAVSLTLTPEEAVQNDFTLYYNDRKIASGDHILVKPGYPAILKIVFNPNATTGKRYFTLAVDDSRGIDIINGNPAVNFEALTLRSQYDVTWNPLKTLLTWIGIILLAALLLWLVVLKRIFFPLIKVGRIVFTGPDNYYISKRITGARKVILTSHKRRQGFMSRLFTGTIIYVQAQHFTPEIEILPLGTKKKIRIRPHNTGDNAWDITPASIFTMNSNGSLTHRSNKITTNFVL